MDQPIGEAERFKEARELLALVYNRFTEASIRFARGVGRLRRSPSVTPPCCFSISLNKTVAACSFQGTAHASRIFH